MDFMISKFKKGKCFGFVLCWLYFEQYVWKDIVGFSKRGIKI